MIRVTCAVIIDGTKIFAAQRGPGSQQALKWEFPGGKVEAEETDENCLKRELDEELQMQVNILEKLPSVFHQYPDFSIELIPFLCSLANQSYYPVEHSVTGWFERDELKKLNWAKADEKVLDLVLEKYL